MSTEIRLNSSFLGVACVLSPPPATDYMWCVTNGLTITSGQHTTYITVDVGSTLGNDTISVYGINSCDNGFPKVIIRTVYPRPLPLIAGTDTVCTGSPIMFTTSGGMSAYQWTMSPDHTLIAGGQVTDSSCTVSWNIAGSQWVRLNYTNSNGCDGMVPDQFNLMVVPGTAVGVSISSSANSICTGTSVTFNANTTFGGTTPHFQWKVNSINQGTDDSVFVYFPANNDLIQCILTSSNLLCSSNNPATSNSITVVVNPILPVSVSISPSDNPVCAGTIVNFTAIPINGGTTPQYQWKLNGLIVGTNSPNYSYMPVNSDTITCTLNSNVLCPSGNPAISNEVAMTVNPILPVGVSIVASSNPFCAGSPVTFTAAAMHGGSTPLFQW
ncbi:MAG: hypothetical protein NT004_02510, partial [Bacteroidetes bacterium]|nr:hypothetical protein [Bacteroidota bacterium]